MLAITRFELGSFHFVSVMGYHMKQLDHLDIYLLGYIKSYCGNSSIIVLSILPESSGHQHHRGATSSAHLTDYAALNGLGFQVVGYHLCQADHSSSCMVADMVASLAAQLARAPQLAAYRDLLLQVGVWR